jgi:hypothetical protein
VTTRLRGLTTVFVIVATALASCSPPTDHSAEDAQFITQHGGDPKALDDRFSTDAQIACSDGADDFLRSIAAHEFKWSDDAKGFTGDKFDKISTVSAGPGLLTLVSDRALLSNGFGAFDPVTFYCLYDAKAKKALRYSQDDPSITAATDVTQENGQDGTPSNEPQSSPSVPDPRLSSQLASMIDHCDEQSSIHGGCDSSLYRPVWKRFATTIGDIIAFDTTSVRPQRQGAASALTYRYVEGTDFDETKLKQYYFTCQNLQYHEANASGMLVTAPKGPAAAKMSDAVCSIAKQEQPAEGAQAPDEPLSPSFSENEQ